MSTSFSSGRVIVDTGQYKAAKEAFVSQLQGGSVARINAVSLTALTTYTLWAVLRNRGITRATPVRSHGKRDDALLLTWAYESAVLVLPIILACTVLASHLVLLNALLVAVSAYVFTRYPETNLSGLRQSHSRTEPTGAKKSHWSKESDDEEDEDEERERKASLEESKGALRRKQRHRTMGGSSISSLPTPSSDPPEPFRVSVESAAEAAYAAATPPTAFVAPGEAGPSNTGRRTSNGTLFTSPPSSSNGHTNGHKGGIPRDSSAGTDELGNGRVAPLHAYVPRNQPFLSVYRAHMMLMTVVCILAVDFPAFPREFGKCETWGTSLMDLGVGSFVFSLGIVSALPMLRSPSQRFKPMRLQLLRDARRSAPLLILGGVRVVMVKGTAYPEHVSEYGVHWNFFFTLAVLPFVGTLIRPVARLMRFSTAGLAVSCLHQATLSLTDLGRWASSNAVARVTLVQQNKEGLASLPGYVAIFLLGLDLGHYILPRDPYLAYRRPTASRQREKTDKLAMVLTSYSVLWWGAYYGVVILARGQASRRLANLAYVLWVTAYNTSFLLAYVMIYWTLLQPLDERALYSDRSAKRRVSGTDDDDEQPLAGDSGQAKTPAILQAINANAFAVFLVANLLTGLVNVTIKTMYASDTTAVVVLLAYVSTLTALAFIAHSKGWRVKL